MSEIENKDEGIVQLHRNETTADTASISTEMPAFESTIQALDEIANENSDILISESEATVQKTKLIDNGEGASVIQVEQNSKLSGENISDVEFRDDTVYSKEPGNPVNSIVKKPEGGVISEAYDGKVNSNKGNSNSSALETSNSATEAFSLSEGCSETLTTDVSQERSEICSDQQKVNTANTIELSNINQTPGIYVAANFEITKNVASLHHSTEDDAVSDNIQDACIKEHIFDTSTSNETVKEIKSNHDRGTPTEDTISHLDTCDSQESLNLVIDEEMSNITEVKDDFSDIKSDDGTNMDVDMEANAMKISDKYETDTDKPQEDILNKSKTKEDVRVTISNKSDEKFEVTRNEGEIHLEKCGEKNGNASEEEAELYVQKSTETDMSNKSKDDDVITIEQPPVPIIEIDDEEDIELDMNLKEGKLNDEQSTNIMDPEKFLELEKNSITENNNATEINRDSENNDKNDTLLEKTSEKPFVEDITPEEAISTTNDMEETNDEVFYNKECINYECPHKHKQYFKVPQFAFSYFKVTKKKFKHQFICADCYDKALDMYEEFCGLINAKQPLLLENIPSGRQEFVEIIDSSDDEDSSSNRDAKTLESTNSAFSKKDLALIESELNDTIKSVLNRLCIQNQLTWSKTILMERLKRLEMETDYVDNELKSLQKQADKMHEGLYTCPKIKIRQLQPLDLNKTKLLSLDSVIQKEIQSIPPVGEIERPPIQLNSNYYAVKNNPIASWVPCKVMELVENGLPNQISYNVKQYKIKFIRNQTQIPKTVPAKYLAYFDPPAVRLPIGTRVIAYFDATSLARGREKINVQSAFYPGIIAEPLKPNNKFRYLIFYDDGYTQYVYHRDVRLVCHVSDCVWEDVHPASRDFIQKYLTQYSINRPMVQTQKGQSMNTESNGYWLHARVVDIDCSLVLMQFEGSKSHTEWIYRGSLRLGPVFKEYQKSLQKSSVMPVSRLSRRTEPFIRYTEDEENAPQQQQADKSVDGNRAVARKTFGRPESMMNSAQSSSNQQQQQQPIVKHLNNSTIYVEDENKPKGKVVYYTAKRNLPPRKYKLHKCAPSCQFEITHNLSAYSPLSKPLLSGWERFIIRQKIKRVVTYRAPCGKILRNMKELHYYLRTTNNALNVDNFDFSHEISCLAEYVIESAIIQKRDISGGQEKMAIPLVNYYDNTLPPECKYSAKVIPTEGVNINTDPAFLIGCDCEDDCTDKTKCACWQLTLSGAKYGNPNAAPEDVGYQYRRLLDHVPTGIYECNANCKCKSSCLNRVVQNSLTMKLQVFKTSNRGWGLRCINDIPRGSFVCVYAGHLLTEAKANEGGQDAGDEYFAELDYIEVAEQIKEGYESEVELPEPDEEDPYHPDLDDDFTPSKSFLTRAKQKQNAIKSTRSSNQEEDSQERQVINFNPNADMNEDSVRENSIRKLYGKDEACYVMDAKISGNLGRYFNHSCAPNMFVQNVFVNTHDLRFPNVAFFSSCNIRAGTELTWNYNYEVGVVPGKVLYCQCGASNCRLRLL